MKSLYFAELINFLLGYLTAYLNRIRKIENTRQQQLGNYTKLEIINDNGRTFEGREQWLKSKNLATTSMQTLDYPMLKKCLSISVEY